MDDYSLKLPDIEERFLPPNNWKIKNFNNPATGHDIYYRTAMVENAKGTIICLPGLSEYGEKYIETARFFNKQNYNFITIDWAYQGFSTRFKSNHHKRHSDGYKTDLSDLHYLITNEVKSKVPLYMLGHSMGGHIGLRYIYEHPNTFKTASFSAPMMGINGLQYVDSFYLWILKYLKKIENLYIPGGHNWIESDRHNLVNSVFSSDKTRSKIHNAWCIQNPQLQIGSPTFKWVRESLSSISFLKKVEILNNIKIPILLACANKEVVVDNSAIKKSAPFIPNAKLLNLENSKHEILVENDGIRDKFLTETLIIFDQ